MSAFLQFLRRKFRPHQLLIVIPLALMTTCAIHSPSLHFPLVASTPTQVVPSSPTVMQNIRSHSFKIVALGDSITETGGKVPGGYVWLLQRYLEALYPNRKIEIINAGISGHKSTDMQARFQRDVIDQKPDLVTINVGVNDVWSSFFDFQTQQLHPEGNLPAGVPLPIYRQKLTEMVKAAKTAGIRTVLLSPTPIREVLDGPENRRLIEYIAAMREVATENDCLFIDLNTPFREVIATYQKHAGRTLNLLAGDGVHPNKAGYRIMTYTILRGLGVPVRELENLQLKY